MGRRGAIERASIEHLLAAARRRGHGRLNEAEAKRLLHLAGFTVPPERVVTSAGEAVRVASRMGFPVVLKVLSRDVLHKTDVGGVQLDLRSAAAVRRAYGAILARVRRAAKRASIDGILVQPQLQGCELILGAMHDPQLGPVLAFGLGGTVVELLGDVAFRVVPIDEREARQMIRDTRAGALLNGFRGGPVMGVEGVVRALMNLSRLMAAFPGAIREIEINPLLVTRDGAVAIDAVAVLAGEPHA